MVILLLNCQRMVDVKNVLFLPVSDLSTVYQHLDSPLLKTMLGKLYCRMSEMYKKKAALICRAFITVRLCLCATNVVFFPLNGMCSGACSQIRVSNIRFLLAFPVALLYVLITISLDAPFIFLIASPH